MTVTAAEARKELARRELERRGVSAMPVQPGQELVTEEHDFNSVNMLKNAPGSAKQLVKDTVAPIFHPIDSIKQVIRLVADPSIAKDAIVERYGSIENAQRSLEEDPMGVGSDLIGLLTLGATAGSRFPGLKPGARSLMESATKFPTGMSRADRKRNIDTMLEERITPDEKGLEKLDEIVNNINTESDGIIADAVEEGTTISAAQVRGPLNGVIAKVRDSIGPDRAKDLKRLQDIRVEFNASLDGLTELSPQKVQQLKKDLYSRINFDARQGSATEISQRGRKAVAQGARESIADLDPRIEALNQRQAPLLDMRDDLSKAANRIDNRNNMGGMGPMLGGGAGATAGAVFGAPGTGAFIGAGIGKLVTSPKMAANAAIMMQRLIDAGHSRASAMIITQQALVNTNRAREKAKEENNQ